MKHSIKSFLVICLLIVFQNISAQTSNPDKYKYDFVVAKDGSGDYKYIQEAIDAMRVFPLKPIKLFIKNGIYTEKIELPRYNVDVTFIGEDINKTIITFNDYAGRGPHIGTFNSYTAKISGNRFRAENITFENSSGPVGQAVALHIDADKATFKNCKFLGNQDTIYHGGEYSRQLFENCYIEGTTDFIFGPATAVFKNCTIHCKSDSYITAPNTPKDKAYGFVFIDCKITTAEHVNKLYLGRPWRYYAKSVFVRCDLPEAIRPEGWHNWGNPENEETAFFAEYKCSGLGSDTSQRVSWSHQLSKKEAGNYTVENIFNTCNPWIFK